MEYQKIKEFLRNNVEITTDKTKLQGFLVQTDLDDNETETDLIIYAVVETQQTDITGEVELIPISEIKSIELLGENK